ncbi:hypothetical protein OG909_17730 [Streptomyces sp. NBC_01754]|nr:hypothetical protein OG909_17730 [Streptomyces sp. NBC_01754]
MAADRPFYSDKHKKHGMNVQILTDPFGRLLWASPPSTARQQRRADRRPQPRHHRHPGRAFLACFADKGYRGAGGTIRVPFRGKNRSFPASQRAVNVAHARITSLVKAVLTLT